jgi:DASS family divalent anion:Na+ symporter
MMRWAAVLAPALLLYFAPLPGFNPMQAHLLAIFAGTIIALVAQPIAMGASVILGMTLLVLTNTLPAARALAGFSNSVVWMIFSAFIFARAMMLTGLGQRIAYLLIRSFGHSSLTLAYCVAATNLIVAPFVPSDTGRGGGIIYPIARSLARAFDSEPGPTGNRLGAYLMLVGFHSTYTTSAMFLTSMVANPVVADFALKIAHVELTWIKWAMASCVPGGLALIAIPWLLFRLNPPEIRDTTAARTLARDELARMGGMSRDERWLVGILGAVMIGWVTTPWHPIPNTFVALAGLCAMIIAKVIVWDTLLDEKRAWDAVVWFAPLLMMADELAKSGVVAMLSKSAFGRIQGWPWMAGIVALVVIYLYVHYGFASMTAHTTALYSGFLTAAVATGAPAFVAVMPLGFFTNLNAGLTHYGTGSAPVFFGPGYVTQATWWRLGFLLSLVNLVIWLGIGLVWWKVLGLW